VKEVRNLYTSAKEEVVSENDGLFSVVSKVEGATATYLLLPLISLTCRFGLCLVPFKLQTFPSHQMFGHMHEALNIDEKNQLHSLHVNCETNLLSLITP
jgi:hypothetical protein